MKHVVYWSTIAYAGSTHEHDFMIYHDALGQWWEKEAQEFIATLGFRDRQWRALGTTNAGTRYEGRLVGDSPELCRGLDSHGFADLKNAMNLNSALSCAMYAQGDPRRFEMGTPAQVMNTMKRCWTIAPSSERIIEDIEAFPRVVHKIIEARGIVVLDEYLRDGKRRVKKDGEEAKLKARSRQTKEKLTSSTYIHPDCEAARVAFLQLHKQG